MCYILSVIFKVLKVRQFGNWIINRLKGFRCGAGKDGKDNYVRPSE